MEVTKKYLGWVIAAALLVMLAVTCTNSGAHKIEDEVGILEDQYHRKVEDLNKQKIKSEKIADSLHNDNLKKSGEIVRLKNDNKDLDKEVSELGRKNEEAISRIKQYTYKDAAEFIAKTYDAPKAVSYTDKGVALGGSVPQRVVETIVWKNHLDQKLSFTEKKLGNLELQGLILDSIIKNKDFEIKTEKNLSMSKDTVIFAADKLNDKQKQENKRLKRNRFIERVIVGAAVVGGILLIN